MICALAEFLTQQINSKGVGSLEDCQEYAFVSGIVAVRSIDSRTLEESKVVLFSFALE